MNDFTHGGNIRELARAAGLQESELLDFSASINPLGPPEWLRPLISAHISSLRHYPDPDCKDLREAVSARYGVSLQEVIVGNGSTELLYLLPRAVSQREALILTPCYTDYARSAAQAGMNLNPVSFQQGLSASSIQDSLVFIGCPNNPTGHITDGDTLRKLAAENPSSIFVIDEAFADFVDNFDSLTRKRPTNVLVLLSLTKIFAIPGLRLGCAVGDPVLLQRIRKIQPTWSVNTLAQAVGVAALSDIEYVIRTRDYVKQQREALTSELNDIPGLTIYPGTANFLLAKITSSKLNARQMAQQLLKAGIAIRVCEDFDGLDARHFRVSVRTEEDNHRLVDDVKQAFCLRQSGIFRRARAKAIMFQGTSSNAGKSVLTAALCRILQQDGYRVAPFKSQNMSLNSFVTRDGGEMGRAQVVQAQACRIEPDVRMNPILLKPNSDTGSQVILMGKPVGNMDVRTYIDFKPQAFDVAKRAYDELAAENDVVVLEGAGSPAEVNLKRHDIVNMSMARYADAPVLVVGDIDRGGIFASFVGTMEVLSEWERALVAGFVVNRFRGQASLLKDALDYTERHTGKQVFGIVPFVRDLRLPEEDSVSFKEQHATIAPNGTVDIAVIDLPHISNFTDFDALRIEPDVNVRVVRSAEELGSPDAVILPGSKNTLSDLQFLREQGLANAICGLHNTEVIGICGGFQMLGSTITDPHGIESNVGISAGLGLLPLATVMASDKTLKRATAKHCDTGTEVRGYEIHHGQTTSTAQVTPMFIDDEGQVAGFASPKLPIWGTYLHGVFDADAFRRCFIDRLRKRRGLSPIGKVIATYDLQNAFDELADVVRQSLNMKRIYQLLGLQ